MTESGFIVNLTHDIDFVRKGYQYITHDLMDLKLSNLLDVLRRDDPYWTFDKIMKMEDDAGCRSTFFFLQESFPWKPLQVREWNLSLGKYKFSDPDIQKIIQKLDRENWEIALHGSFNSYRDKDLLIREKRDLESAVGKEVHGVRQHFLNLDIPRTWQLQKEAGFSYDSSLGIRSNIGFYDNHYTPFRNRETGMLIIPLTLMDTYLACHLNGDMSQAWRRILKLINEAEENNAVLTVLWHNNYFNENEFPGFSNLYNKMIWECKNRGAKFYTSYEIYEMFNSVDTSVAVDDMNSKTE